MAGLGPIAAVTLAGALALAGLVGGTWYYTVALEPIDPDQGIYGMAGLEIWIDINARMPAAARRWSCETLRSRERAVLGGKSSLPPYGCQPDFEEAADLTPYQTAVEANLAQASAGLDPAQVTALRACFDSRMAAQVTQDEIAAVNAFDQTVMSRVIVAVSESLRTCKAGTGG